ncbi:hypothetical protein K439DRAFT_870269 [Ramaria rubella]|nr:hypothetical protein K439DRAFT_870269 [Ramaria rubella]
MPAPARISVPVKQPTPVKATTNSSPKTPASIPRPKARMVQRRRPRGRLEDTDTDDDLVREPHSDSDSDSAASTLESESVSDSEPEDDSKPQVRVASPATSPVAAGSASPPSPTKAVFPESHNWSEMVADENANGAAALPVIDFADLSSHAQTASLPSHIVPSPPPSVPEQPRPSRDTAATVSASSATRKPGQSARQAYLSRLDNDPAYVPTLGQFWSHDERLLDKDLRSLSGWWRGRWQGRGRGARGRGGFAGGREMRGTRGRGGFGYGDRSARSEEAPQAQTPLRDHTWTHDGFEEMKKDDEAKPPQYPSRGRGGFPRGRRSFKGGFAMRGSFARRSSSPHSRQARLPSESAHSSTPDTLIFGNGSRPWFQMKPERVWTKQFDGYLYLEAQLKPVHYRGLGQGVRVKLPRTADVGKKIEGLDDEAVIIRLPLSDPITPKTAQSTSKEPLAERGIIVKLPLSQKQVKERSALVPEDVTTAAPPPIDDSQATPSAATPPYLARPMKDVPPHTSNPAALPPRRGSDVVVSLGRSNIVTPMKQPVETPPLQRPASEGSSDSHNVANAGPSQSHTRTDSTVTENAETALPPQIQSTIPAFQAVASPFQPSPPYGSPYAYATSGLPLPPGIAISESGVTYEIATGRAVYLHTPPPPPPPPPMQVPMYNPRPMAMRHAPHGSVHFLPHHAHHAASMSVSPPAFLSSPPIFSLPRQSSRIEIRAPGEEKGKGREVEAGQSGSRLAVNVNAEPFTPSSHLQSQGMGYYAAEAQHQAFDEAQHQHQQSMYQPTSYYYPVGADGGAPYGYGQQYANVNPGQPQQYDTYGQEPYPPQHAVYYQ